MTAVIGRASVAETAGGGAVPLKRWQLDTDLRFISVDGYTPATTGAQGNIVGRLLEEAFANDWEYPQILAAHSEALAGRPGSYPYESAGASFECYVEPLRSGSGRIYGVAGIAVDVTEKRQLEQALHESRRQLAAMQEIAGLGSWEETTLGEPVSWSAELFRIVGFPVDPTHTPPAPFERFCHEDDAAALGEALKASLRTNRPFSLEHRIRRPDGSLRWVRTAGSRRPRVGPGAASAIFTTVDITEQRATEERLRAIAYVDPLTGLGSRQGFETQLAALLEARAGKGSPVFVLCIDVDGFKAINHTLGHEAGDALLIDVGRRLGELGERVHFCARFAGDEFVLAASQTQGEFSMHQLAIDIIALFTPPFNVNGRDRTVGATIGICGSLAGSDATTLVRGAENALHSAKKHCPGYYSFLVPEMRDEALRRSDNEADLHRAIREKQFKLVYQPIVDAETRSIVSAEALIRWHHPERGVIPPDEFIGIAEGSGQIVEIGAWVLAEATAACKGWQSIAEGPVRVAVNVSARQLTHPGFVGVVSSALRRADLAPDCLELEITETAAMVDVDYVIGVLRQLREFGVRFSIDDFGTGYSSLSFLKRLPVDVIKIDRSFVANIERDHGDRALAEAIIFVSHGSGLSVVAEGVENERQFRILKSFDCDNIQGYLIGRPQPLDEFEAALRKAPRVGAVRELRPAV